MRLCVFGSRGALPRDREIDEALAKLLLEMGEPPDTLITELVSGTAPGADRCGEAWARRRGILVRAFPADWKQYGNAAGPKRNRVMADYTNIGIGFWYRESSGTANMSTHLTVLRKPVLVLEWRGHR